MPAGTSAPAAAEPTSSPPDDLPEQVDIAGKAALVPSPTAVASDNVGKDATEATTWDIAASHNAEHANSALLCGPILRYTRQSEDFGKWHGSAMIVTSRKVKAALKLFDGKEGGRNVKVDGFFEEKERFFWRFDMDIELAGEDREIKYVIHVGDDETPDIERAFWVPAKAESFNILFHSCNGFCSGAEKEYDGPTLWKDVLRGHEAKPFHVMIGGGDQIYSDGVREKGAPLEAWTTELTPHKKAKIPFTEELRLKVDQWYFTNSCDWFNTTPFREATAQIPSINMWDDHDIIDGFGSYKDKWQRAPVFVGIGEIAWKYYCLFQHHINPDTSDNPDPQSPSESTGKPEYANEPSYILHPQKGPYIKHRGISLMSNFGPEIAFVGFDCRTDRTQKIICNPSTYEAIFARMDKDVIKGKTKHLLVLLGVPIAYPRLVWLESLLDSHLVTFLRAVNKVIGGIGGQFNTFDENAELLDDLQDHWACGLHKKERNAFVVRLQDFAAKKQVRITILSGDVHLAAVGRFFSKKSLQVPQVQDHRYMVNVISSAITNAPPPPTVAQVLNSRNKVHHLDSKTDENLMKMFNVSVDNSSRHNQTTYPARNYCIIRQQRAGDNALVAATAPAEGAGESTDENQTPKTGNDDVRAKKVRGTAVDVNLKLRDDGAETSLGAGGEGALSISIQIEVDSKSPEGADEGLWF